MSDVCKMHLLLLPVSDKLESEAIVKYIRTLLLEMFSLTDDSVVIELELSPIHQPMAVSVTYDDTWRCTIYLNDDGSHVVRESENWYNLYGADLLHDERHEILKCGRRLDIFCDPDAECLYDRELEALTEFLRLNFPSHHSFDPIQNIFLRESV